MSVLIKGMKMPKEQPMRIVLNPNGQLFVDHGTRFTEYEAVELPPHGELIERDKLIADAKAELLWVDGEEKYWYWNDGANNVIDLAKTAQTVIEADRSDSPTECTNRTTECTNRTDRSE